jgi:hypothetical protein
MGSSSDLAMPQEQIGIIPRVIQNLFMLIKEKEKRDPRYAFAATFVLLRLLN